MTAEIEKLKAELVKKDKNETVWIPEIHNTYMCIDSFGCVCSTVCEDILLEKQRIDFNNAYHSNNKTREHLEWYRDNVLRVQNKLMQLHELLCPDYFPDWGDEDECKWHVYYDNKNKCFVYTDFYINNHFVVYFTAEAAEKACEILNKEILMMKG